MVLFSTFLSKWLCKVERTEMEIKKKKKNKGSKLEDRKFLI